MTGRLTNLLARASQPYVYSATRNPNKKKTKVNLSVSRTRKEICQKHAPPLPKLGAWPDHINETLRKQPVTTGCGFC